MEIGSFEFGASWMAYTASSPSDDVDPICALFEQEFF
jgi:hypothetical protein